MASLAAQRMMNLNSGKLDKHYQRIASGQRIVNSGDDAAGLSIAEKMRAQIRSMQQAERNANDGISFSQVAEGGLTEVSNLLIRMRELSIQAGSDTVGDNERSFINEEFKSSLEEINRIANVTTFNGTHLLNGTPVLKHGADPEDTEEGYKNNLQFQVGIYNNAEDRVNFDLTANDVRATTLGLVSMEDDEEIGRINTLDIDSALASIDIIDKAINTVSASRARLGATQNKMHSTVNNLQIMTENLSQARSRIADTDIAAETAELVRENILQSANISILTQANNAPMQALKLL
jgi:flagellin